ncbi:hypothetical protein K439DRAFT_1624020 [Ramaria rubella]|nr:hypothetical protein K439DRAFT_1624020 [Ramaria rubella]
MQKRYLPSVSGKVGRCPTVTLSSRKSSRVPGRWGVGGSGEEHAFESVRAAEKRHLRQMGPMRCGSVICERWEGEGEEVWGDGNGDIVEVVFGGGGTDFEGACRGVAKEEGEEGAGVEQCMGCGVELSTWVVHCGPCS